VTGGSRGDELDFFEVIGDAMDRVVVDAPMTGRNGKDASS